MNENQNLFSGVSRRDFIRSGSFATAMAMMGGVQLFAQASATPAAENKAGIKVKVAVVGLGTWGREILRTLARIPSAQVVAICDKYGASVRRAAPDAPNAKTVEKFEAILEDKEITAVVIATPTHQHKDLVIAALKAGKHVYCEAPIAHTIEDAKEIAKAAKAAPQFVFQPGLQLRSDPQRHHLVPFIRSGALGTWAGGRAQWHKKMSWRANSPNPEREKELNWRLDPALSLGLIGELSCHQLDQAAWFFNARPTAVYGSGAINFWKDGREVADTVHALVEYSNGVQLAYDGTLANSFDADYEMFFGSDSAVMLRESSAWLFKEVDAPLLGWEVYAKKENFYKETGIVLKVGGSKATDQVSQQQVVEPYTNTPLSFALGNFLRNAFDIAGAVEDFKSTFGEDDPDGLKDHLSKVRRQPAADYQDGYENAVTAIKAAEAVRTGKRVEISKDLYELA
jgi:predicted dehydrogenase